MSQPKDRAAAVAAVEAHFAPRGPDFVNGLVMVLEDLGLLSYAPAPAAAAAPAAAPGTAAIAEQIVHLAQELAPAAAPVAQA